MFCDYYLKSLSKSDMESALRRAGILVGDDEYAYYTCDVAEVGIIQEETGELDRDGNPVMHPIEGWHVNLRVRGELTSEQLEMLPVIKEPKNPHCVFAGGILK